MCKYLFKTLLLTFWTETCRRNYWIIWPQDNTNFSVYWQTQKTGDFKKEGSKNTLRGMTLKPNGEWHPLADTVTLKDSWYSSWQQWIRLVSYALINNLNIPSFIYRGRKVQHENHRRKEGEKKNKNIKRNFLEEFSQEEHCRTECFWIGFLAWPTPES